MRAQACTGEQPCEDTGRREASISQRKRPQKEPTRQTLWSQTSSLWNGSWKHKIIAKPSSLWYFVMAAVANSHRSVLFTFRLKPLSVIVNSEGFGNSVVLRVGYNLILEPQNRVRSTACNVTLALCSRVWFLDCQRPKCFSGLVTGRTGPDVWAQEVFPERKGI